MKYNVPMENRALHCFTHSTYVMKIFVFLKRGNLKSNDFYTIFNNNKYLPWEIELKHELIIII